MHGFPGQDTVVEEEGHIGHGAILHGCTIGRNALVGMSAVIIDGARIGENSIVGASAFVKANAEMPANHLIVGSPAKAIRTLSEQELAWKSRGRGSIRCWWSAANRRCIRWNRSKKQSRTESGWRLMRICGRNHPPEGKNHGREIMRSVPLRRGGVYR
ncbi:phenylacetic acid degradation protein PaaY [Klebsiella michiganensis]|nr:phenylacetic acid degradation protein PaaY [Klebsiella michiganensis]